MIRTSLISAWSHRRRLASTTFAIVLGIAFLTGTLVLRDSATAGFSTAFASANAGIDALVRNADDLSSGDEPRAPIDVSIADEVAAVDGVAAVAPTVSGLAQILDSDGEPVGGNGPPTLGTNWVTDPALNGYHLTAGRAPAKPGEVVIDARSAREAHLDVGATTTVLAPGPVPVTVVGIAAFGDADSLGSTTLVAFTLPDAQRLLLRDPARVSGLLVAADSGVSQDELVRRLDRVVPAGTEAISGSALTAEQEADIQSDFLGFFTTALLVFAAIALLVAVFSIFNTFTVLSSQRSRESALLRAIGASRAQVISAGLVEALAVAAVGTALGIGTGVVIGLGLRSLLGADGLGMPIDGLVVSAATVGTAAATGVVVTVGAALLPALRAARIPPIAALRDAVTERLGVSRGRAIAGALLLAVGVAAVFGASNGDSVLALTGVGALSLLLAFLALGPFAAPAAARLAGLAVGRRGVAGDLAWRNAARNPRRTAGTAAALLVGVSVVSLFTVLGSSIKASMDTSLERGFRGDLVIVPPSGGGAGLDQAMASEMSEISGVSTVASLAFPTVRLDGSPTRVTATDLAAMSQVTDVDVRSGDAHRPGADAFAVSEEIADANDWNVGDRITASFADGISESVRLAYIYGDRTLLGDVVFPAAIADRHIAQHSVQLMAIRFTTGADDATTRQAVDAVAEASGDPQVQDREEFLATQSAQVDVLLTIVYALLVVAIGIAGMGIANTLSLSIHERTRELGLLRAVGVSRRQIKAMVRWESVIVATFGAVGGVGLGVFGGWAMMRALAASQGFGTFTLPVVPLTVILALGTALGVLAALRPARRAARLDVLAAIATD
ncbi:MAG TPA: FtsX-like permease family protein [Acidimicrobiales bacterium]|nr:FtsX-like permease family protein [Acidimicrobiales bacterium]